jgi:hypothetical protein
VQPDRYDLASLIDAITDDNRHEVAEFGELAREFRTVG